MTTGNVSFANAMKKVLLITLFCACTAPLFAQESLFFNPLYLPSTDTTWIFLPKDYARSSKPYPVVYLLHEQGGNYKQWNGIISIQKYADAYGFIIVCPDGQNDAWYINSPRKATSKYEDFFIKDLHPAIKQKYRVDADQVFITGIGMGGFGAMHLFWRNPDLFRSAGSCSGILDLQSQIDNIRLRTLLGDSDYPYVNLRNFSLVNQVDKLAAAQREIIFDCGSDNPHYESHNYLKKRCDDLHIKATYVSQPGKHDKAYWQRAIRWHFDFFKRMSRE